METSILIASVTISWIYLAYSVSRPILKELLHFAVLINLITVAYMVVASTTLLLNEATQIYLTANLSLFTAFIIFYLLFWTVDKLKLNKERKENFNG